MTPYPDQPTPAPTPPTQWVTFSFEAYADGVRTGGRWSAACSARTGGEDRAWLPDDGRALAALPDEAAAYEANPFISNSDVRELPDFRTPRPATVPYEAFASITAPAIRPAGLGATL
ncbi:hypothetical protein ETD83_22595 [Actinomadura soli]|uniref:Uncharacterized protein n=1 Tax=Actinomadura soli TaxID=2508997 RepID=A0A5C4J8T8_9ACTN|nr:hypothetical protein [Actinomadura soli]TMQ95320.1 hypothetical protein ETD83_22595 [Actinomadura soli]